MDEVVCLTDFFRTFADILDVDVPKDAGEDSYNIHAVLANKDRPSPIREATVHHSVCGQFAIRKGDWKLIEGSGDGDFPRNEKGGVDAKVWAPTKNAETGEWHLDYFDWKPDDKHQLFDMRNDPYETKDLAKEKPEKVQELLDLLNQYREQDRSVPISK